MANSAPGNWLLHRLAAGDRAALEGHLLPVTLKAGQVLNEPGSEITQLHFVVEGAVSGVILLSSGVTIEALFIGREGVVGSMASASPYQSFGRTIVQVAGAALRVEAKAFRAVAAERPGVALMMDGYKSHQHADLAQSVACNAAHRVGPRLAKWLLRCHDRVDGDVLPLTQDLIGQMIGSQRTTVTEQAGELQRAGLIRYHRGQLTVLDRPGLERAACECYAAVRTRELALA